MPRGMELCPRHVGLRPTDERAHYGGTLLVEVKVNERLLRFTYVSSSDTSRAREARRRVRFYRLNESNAATPSTQCTYSTRLIDPCRSPKDGRLLQQRQDSDGSFQSIYSADYVLRALDLWGCRRSSIQTTFCPPS